MSRCLPRQIVLAFAFSSPGLSSSCAKFVAGNAQVMMLRSYIQAIQLFSKKIGFPLLKFEIL